MKAETTGPVAAGKVARVREYIIRPYRSADAEGVRAVLEATYGVGGIQRATLEWWSFGCPEATSGFMVAEAGGRVVGLQPMGVFPFTDGNAVLKGGLLTGVAVHPEFRRQGIFSALVQGCEQQAWRLGAEFVTTMPNERSRPGFLKMGYVDLGRRRFLIRPLDSPALGRAVSPVPLLGWLAGIVAGAGQAVLKPSPRRDSLTVREVRTVDPATEEIERSHVRHFPGLRMRRSVGWWRWRYLDSPQQEYRLLEARTRDGQLVGLAVTVAEVREGVRMAYLMDISVRSPDLLPGLVASVLESARKDAALAVCVVASAPGTIQALRRAGFWAVPRWAPVKRFYTVVRFNPSIETRVRADWRRIQGWYQMLGDWDNL